MHGPMDPRTSGRAYANRGAEPAKATGPKGPQAKGSPSVDRSKVGNGGSNIAVGGMSPSAKAK